MVSGGEGGRAAEACCRGERRGRVAGGGRLDAGVRVGHYFHFATPPEGSPAVAHAMKAPAPPLP